jgi:hypothetical protein
MSATRFALLTLSFAALVLLGGSLAHGDIRQQGKLRLSFDGEISPRTLPRRGLAPVAIGFAGRITTTDHSVPPQLRRIEIDLNRAGKLDYTGLPVCSLDEIQPSTTEAALAACGDAKVGEGRFAASVAIPEQSPFPSYGPLTAFNGREHGQPVIYAHVYSAKPLPISFTLTFHVASSHGTFGTLLTADFPHLNRGVGAVREITLALSRSFQVHGRPHSYLLAGCPVPEGFSVAPFLLARAAFYFASGPTVRFKVNSSCKARG